MWKDVFGIVGRGGDLALAWNQLIDDLAYFQNKLRELETLDPMDFTGLTKTYRDHEKRIREILEGLCANHAMEA